jgi:hypothetical protein
MKKKIKILKNNDRSSTSTFLTDVEDDSFAFQPLDADADLDCKKIDLSREDKVENKYKKKKAINKKDGFNRGLRYSTPSQRNHSSVYE